MPHESLPNFTTAFDQSSMPFTDTAQATSDGPVGVSYESLSANNTYMTATGAVSPPHLMRSPTILSTRSEAPTLDSLHIADSNMDVDSIVPKPLSPLVEVNEFRPSIDSQCLSRDPAERFHQIASRYRRISQVCDRSIDILDILLTMFREARMDPGECRGRKQRLSCELQLREDSQGRTDQSRHPRIPGMPNTPRTSQYLEPASILTTNSS